MFLSQALCVLAAEVDQLYTPMELARLVFDQQAQLQSVSNALRRYASDKAFEGFHHEKMKSPTTWQQSYGPQGAYFATAYKSARNGKIVLHCSGGIWKFQCKQSALHEALLFCVMLLQLDGETVCSADQLLEHCGYPLPSEDCEHFQTQCQIFVAWQGKHLGRRANASDGPAPRFRASVWQAWLSPALKVAAMQALVVGGDLFLNLPDRELHLLRRILVTQGLKHARQRQRYLFNQSSQRLGWALRGLGRRVTVKQDRTVHMTSRELEPITQVGEYRVFVEPIPSKQQVRRWRLFRRPMIAVSMAGAAMCVLALGLSIFKKSVEPPEPAFQNTKFETVLPVVTQPIDL